MILTTNNRFQELEEKFSRLEPELQDTPEKEAISVLHARVRRFLDRYDIPYVYRDMEVDPYAARQVRWWTGGYESHPTVQIGGDILVEPSTSELLWSLSRNGFA